MSFDGERYFDEGGNMLQNYNLLLMEIYCRTKKLVHARSYNDGQCLVKYFAKYIESFRFISNVVHLQEG